MFEISFRAFWLGTVLVELRNWSNIFASGCCYLDVRGTLHFVSVCELINSEVLLLDQGVVTAFL